MARPTADDPVRQSVLDRLIDDRGDAGSSGRHGQSARYLKECVRRDLEDLLNTKRSWSLWPSAWEDLDDSLVNYGIPDFTGAVFAGPQGQMDLKRLLEDIIRRFEPRLKNVQIEMLDRRRDLSRRLRFRLKAVLRLDPYTEQIAFESEIDPGSKAIRVRDSAQ